MTSHTSLAPRAALLTLATLILAAPSFSRAEEPKTPASPETSGSSASAEAAQSQVASLNVHELALTGAWSSVDTSRGAAAGTMTLDATRHLKLQLKPIGTLEIPALEGAWSADAEYLHLEVAGRGKARIAYVLTGEPKSLEVQYENGMAQIFFPVDADAPTTPAAPVLP